MPNKPKSITNSNRVSPSRRGEGSQLIWNENTKKWMVK
jgi:hypothetical protein